MEISKETQMFVNEINAAKSVEEVLTILSEVSFGAAQEACNVRGFNVCEKTVKAAAVARLAMKCTFTNKNMG